MFKIGDKVRVTFPFIPLVIGSDHVISKVFPGLIVEVNNNPELLFAMKCFELVQEEVDPFTELKAAHAAGKKIELLVEPYGWGVINRPDFDSKVEYYRIKPEPELTPHVHAELIHAWADGAEIQYLDFISDTWERATAPQWKDDKEWRTSQFLPY